MLKKLRALLHCKSLMSNILLTHILVLVLPIVINVAVETFIINSVREEVEKSGFLVAENARNDIDHIIGNIEKITRQLNSNESMLPIYQYNIKNDNYNLKDSIYTLKFTCQSTDDIDDLFVYNGAADMIITTTGRGDSRTFVDVFYDGTDMNYERWADDMKLIKSGTFRVVYRADTREVAYIEYICPLTGSYMESYNTAESEFPAIITIRMNLAKLKLTSEIQKNYPGVSFYVVDSDGDIIGNADIDERDAQYILDKCAEVPSATFEKNGAMHICRRSEKNDWIYVTSTPIWTYNHKSIVAIAVVILSSVLLLMLGLKLISNFVKTNYGGLINMSDRIIRQFNMADSVKLKNINECFDKILDERERFANEVDRMNEAACSMGILKLLEGFSIKNNDTVLVKIDERMASDTFMVMCCRIEGCEELYSDSKYRNISNDEKMKDAFFIVKNVMTELIEAEYSIIDVQMKNEIVFLVGNNHKDVHKFGKSVYSIAQQFADYAEEKFCIECIISIGRAVHSYQDISDSYFDTLGALRYSLLLRDNRVILAERCVQRSDHYEITPEQKQRLTINISVGNSNGAIDVLNELYDENIERRRLSYEMIKCFLVELSSIYEGIDKPYSDDSENIVIQVLNCTRIGQTKQIFLRYTEQLCNAIDEKKNDSFEVLVDKIKQYIDKYYADEDINVFGVANALGMSREYVSKIFKKFTGESILDAIHKKRVGEAKILLADGVKVNDTAKRVGYANANIFIRRFKQYVGTTPKQFADANKGEDGKDE